MATVAPATWKAEAWRHWQELQAARSQGTLAEIMRAEHLMNIALEEGWRGLERSC